MAISNSITYFLPFPPFKGKLCFLQKYTALLGEWDINNELDTETRKDFNVVNIVQNPDVDLALMEVEGDIDLSIYTPICLPKPGKLGCLFLKEKYRIAIIKLLFLFLETLAYL